MPGNTDVSRAYHFPITVCTICLWMKTWHSIETEGTITSTSMVKQYVYEWKHDIALKLKALATTSTSSVKQYVHQNQEYYIIMYQMKISVKIWWSLELQGSIYIHCLINQGWYKCLSGKKILAKLSSASDVICFEKLKVLKVRQV